MKPDFFETQLRSISYFTFLLSANAIGVDDPMILEISVDYGKGRSQEQLIANVWARKKDSGIKVFIISIDVPNKRGNDVQDELIFKQLNRNEFFVHELKKYVNFLREAKLS